MKNICNTSKKYEEIHEDDAFYSNPFFQQVDLAENKDDFVFSKPQSVSKLIKDEELPCCSSQVKYESAIYPDQCQLVKKEIKDEPESYDTRYKKISLEKSKKSQRKKIDSPLFEKDLQSSPSSSMKSLKKENGKTSTANFYLQKMRLLIYDSGFMQDKSIISTDLYDYKKVIFNQKDRCTDKKVGIEVLNKDLIYFDEFLAIPTSLPHLSRREERKIFQIKIRKEVNHLKGEVFSHFVRLSLGDQIAGGTYTSWKKSISEKLLLVFKNIKKIILKDHSEKDFGEIRKDVSFEKYYLDFFTKILVRETLQHALFSLLIEIDGELKNIFISRAGMSFFLNKYSDYFLKELISCKESGLMKRTSYRSYISWRNIEIENIKNILKSVCSKFENFLKEDRDSIHERVLILKKSGFHRLMDQELSGLINAINQLMIVSEGNWAFFERACRHFYKKEFYRKHIQKKIEHGAYGSLLSLSPKREDRDSEEVKNSPVDYLSEIEEKKHSVKMRSKKIKKDPAAPLLEKGKSNFSKTSEIYHQSMCSFLRKIGKADHYLISNGFYDYRRVWWRKSSLPAESCREIEVTNEQLLSFDSSFNRGFFNGSPFSASSRGKNLQEKFKEKIDKTLREPLFLDFVEMSLSSKLRKKKTYPLWKEFILKKVNKSLIIISKEIFSDYERKKMSRVINTCLSFYTKSLMKEIMRYSLFSIPIENEENIERFFVSRAGFSLFLNKYSSHFLTALIEYGKTSLDFTSGTPSYVYWKKSRSHQINRIMSHSQSSFIKIVEKDHDLIRQDVLVFEKNGFRLMTDNEFKNLINLIHRLIDSQSYAGLIGKAIRHFYKEEYNTKKNYK